MNVSRLIPVAADAAGSQCLFSDIWIQANAISLGMMPVASFRPLLEHQYRIKWQQYTANYPGLQAMLIQPGDTPVGYLWFSVDAEQACLIDIAVLPECQSQGLGAQAIEQLVDYLQQHKVENLVLHVLRQNPAFNLYKRIGFVVVGEDDMYFTMQHPLRQH